jgi:CubicO group peptidase (beta-lactamase class C family)
MAPAPDNKLAALPVEQSDSVDRSLDRLGDWLGALHSDGTFNGTVLIAKDGNLLFKKHHGCADLVGRVPLSDQSSFSLASVSMPFTALGIMLLAHADKLALDDLLAKHVPEVAFYEGITLRHLLHHTSGIADHIDLVDQYWNEGRLLTMPDLIALFARYKPRAYFAAGQSFEFSNTGYAFLGEVIGRASGSSYPAFMSEAIFKPLGMNDTTAFNLTIKEFPLRSRVYGLQRSVGRTVLADLNFLDGIFGDGGIYSSAEDLLRWDVALRAGTLLRAEIYQQAYESGRLNNGEATGYGFGWEIEPSNVVEHWGAWEGFVTHVRRDLMQNTLLVMLSNLGPASTTDPICEALAAFVGRMNWSGATQPG